jgi:hypothetical protein
VQTIYIKVMMTEATLVLMAEAAAMALAAIVTDCLNMHRHIFLSDNQLLVQFLNHSDQARSGESNTSLRPSQTSQDKEMQEFLGFKDLRIRRLIS